MKSGTVIALALILLGGAVVGIWMWRKWAPTSSAEYEPTRARFTAEEKTFIRASYDFLESQLTADEEAAKHGHFASVRDFATAVAADHQNQARRLKELALNVEPDFHVETGRGGDRLQKPPSAAFDREYLDSAIRKHEERLESLEHVSIDGKPELVRFISLWRPMLNRHLAEARRLQAGLPKVGSDLPLLLLIGVLCVSTASLMKLGTWWREQRRSKAY